MHCIFRCWAQGLEPGDEVITVAHMFVATVSAIVHCGATPVLIEVGSDYNMNPTVIERAITPKTKALLPVHLNGRVCDMNTITQVATRHRLAVIEDAAQALGATFGGKGAGSFGLAGCFSFYPFKVLGGFGDGGAITTDDERVARMATLLRYNGEKIATPANITITDTRRFSIMCKPQCSTLNSSTCRLGLRTGGILPVCIARD